MKITYEYDPMAGHFAMFVDGQKVPFATIRHFSDERLNFMDLHVGDKLRLADPTERRFGLDTGVKTYVYEIEVP